MDLSISPRRSFLLPTLCLVYVACGIISMLSGPALPVLAAHTGVPLDIAGWIFTASALGFALGVTISGSLSARVSAKYLLIVGVTIITVAAIVIPWTHIFALLLAAQLVIGIGFGVIDVSINVIATLTFHDMLSETLNNLHSAFGLGALIGPLLLSLALSFFNESIWAFLIGMMIALISIILLLRQPIPAIVKQQTGSQEQPIPTQSNIFLQAVLWFMALQMFFYIAAETGFSGWIATVTSKGTGVSLVIAAPTAALFWLGLTGGRLLGARLLKRMILSENQLLYLSFIGSGISGLLVAIFPRLLWIDFIASLLTGLFLGPIFPGIMAIASRRFVHTLGIISSVMLFSAGASGVIFPVLIGVSITHLGLGWGMAIPALAGLLIALPFYLATKLSEKHSVLQFTRKVHTMKEQETTSSNKNCRKEQEI